MVSSLNFQTNNSVSLSTKDKKLENGEDIEQGSSSAVVLNQRKRNWTYKNVFLSRETWNAEFIIREM